MPEIKVFVGCRQSVVKFPITTLNDLNSLRVCRENPRKMSLRLTPSYSSVTILMCLVGVLAIGPITHLASQQTDEYGYYRRQDTSTGSMCAGLTSYYACAFEDGGGCCPQGLICGANQACMAPPTTSTTTTLFCDQGWDACPSSYGGQFRTTLHHQ